MKANNVEAQESPHLVPFSVSEGGQKRNKRAPIGMGVFMIFLQSEPFTLCSSCLSQLRKCSLYVLVR